jgi:hypothetical protein
MTTADAITAASVGSASDDTRQEEHARALARTVGQMHAPAFESGQRLKAKAMSAHGV